MTERPKSPERVDPPHVAGEQTMYEAWLDYHRATLLMKCDGLSDDQLRERSVSPSSLSLLGLVRHMTDVERAWFRRVLLDEDAKPLYWTADYYDYDFDDVMKSLYVGRKVWFVRRKRCLPSGSKTGA